MSKYSEIGVSDNFSSGASYLISEANFDRFVAGGQKYLGRPDEKGDCYLFVTPNNEITEMIDKYPDNPRKWEEELGLEEYSLSNDVHKVDIDSPLDYKLTTPEQNIPGANSFYVDTTHSEDLPHTVGGISEGVLINADNPLLKTGVGKTSVICTADGVRKAKDQLLFDNYVRESIDKKRMCYIGENNPLNQAKNKIKLDDNSKRIGRRMNSRIL